MTTTPATPAAGEAVPDPLAEYFERHRHEAQMKQAMLDRAFANAVEAEKRKKEKQARRALELMATLKPRAAGAWPAAEEAVSGGRIDLAAYDGDPALRRVVECYLGMPASARPLFLAGMEMIVADGNIGPNEGEGIDYDRVLQRFAAAGEIFGVDASEAATASIRTINRRGLACERTLADRGVSLDWLYLGNLDRMLSRLAERGREIVAAAQMV